MKSIGIILIIVFMAAAAIVAYGVKLENELSEEMYKHCEKTEYMVKGSKGLWQFVYKCPQEVRELYTNKGIQ